MTGNLNNALRWLSAPLTSEISKSQNNKRYFLIYALLLIVKIVALIIFVKYYPTSFLWPDSYSYIEPAKMIWEGGGFANSSGAETYRTPGYSLFLAPSFGMNISLQFYAGISQMLLILAIAYTSYKITMQISKNHYTAHISSILVLASPDIMISQFSVLSEILFSFLIILGVYIFLTWQLTNRNVYIACALLSITAATFVRPASIYLTYLLVFIALIVTCASPSINRKGAIIWLLLGIVLHAAAVNLWQYRNFELANTKEFSTVQSLNLHGYISASIEAKAERKSWESVSLNYFKSYYEAPVEKRSAFAKKVLLENIEKYPVESAMIFAKGFLVNAFDPGTGLWLIFFKLRNPDSGIIWKFANMSFKDFIFYLLTNELPLLGATIAGLIYMLIIWAMFFRGLYVARFSAGTYLLLATIFYFLVIAAGPYSISRFRVPIMPLIIILSSIGLTSLLGSSLNRARRI